jgi:hypothetical protein
MTTNASNQTNSNNSGNSGNKKNNNRGRRRRNNNKRYNAKSNNSDNNKNAGSNNPNNNSGNKKSNNSKRRRNYSRNRNKTNNRLTGIDYISTKYLNLLEQHIQARKKYYENFDRVNSKTRTKLEKNFVESQKAFLDFKKRLKPEELELYEKRYESLKVDTNYSDTHQLTAAEKVGVSTDDIVDPHLLRTQIEASYKEDTEESVGSYEDYKKYKNIE